ncbi:MAG: hypothetical protein AAGI38_14975 [Bacteroidota bacterium]
MKNNIIAVLTGVFTGWVVVFSGEAVQQQFITVPEGFDYTDPVQLQAFSDSLHTWAWISFIIIWGLSAFLGGMITGKVGKGNWKKLCLITGGILLLGSIANMFIIPHPLWVNVITVLMYFPLAYVGGSMLAPKGELIRG